MTGEHPSREDLSAYVDGELPSWRQREIAKSLLHDSEASARVDAYRRQKELLRLGLSLAVTARAEEWTPGSSASARGREFRVTRRLALTSAASFGAALLAGGWWVEHRLSLQRTLIEFTQQAMLAHLSYRTAASEKRLMPEAIEVRLRAILGASVYAPELSRFGLRLTEARENDFGTGRGILLAYEGTSADGRVSCYFARVGDGGETQFKSMAVAGLGAVSRIVDGLGYAVVGKLPLPILRDIATAGLRYGS